MLDQRKVIRGMEENWVGKKLRIPQDVMGYEPNHIQNKNATPDCLGKMSEEPNS